MLQDLMPPVPPQALQIALVLLLSALIGLGREEHKQRTEHYAFGGIRAFPLIGLVSYTLALLSGDGVLPWLLGFALVGGFMLLSYQHKLTNTTQAGLTTEVSALATYLLGLLIYREQYWFAVTVVVLSVFLLELKKGLEGLTEHVAPGEITTVAKFLLVTVVILPIVPHQDFTRFHLNPFKTWLVVVAVSGVSFGSYLLQRLLQGRGGIMLSALLGGAYSSTVTTVVLARRAREGPHPNLFAGSILAASGMMYARLVLLLAFFNAALAARLAPSFGALALAAGLTGWAVSRRRDPGGEGVTNRQPPKNPLELRAAFLFALVFVAVLVLTELARQYLGRGGLYGLAALMGLTDVDPFILGLTQREATSLPLVVAASAVVIAAASNNLVKAFYARSFADRETGRRSFVLLAALAAAGLLPLVWL